MVLLANACGIVLPLILTHRILPNIYITMAYTAYDDDEQRKPIANQKNYDNTDEYNDTDLEETDENDTDNLLGDEEEEYDGAEVNTDDDNADNEDEETETYASTRDRDVADAEHALRALRDLTSDNDEQMPHNGKIKLSAILGGDMLGGQWFRKQFWFIVTLTAMLIVYISNRYYCQQEMLETKALSDTLLDRRYKALTRSSQLKEKTRRSYIEESLVDTTLQTANTPSFNLKIE